MTTTPPQAQKIPPHLESVVQAIAKLDPFADRHSSEAVRAGRLRELRRQLITIAMSFLQAAPGEGAVPVDAAGAARRGLAYVQAVGHYINTTSPHYPVDPYLVAMNGHLQPVVRSDFGPKTAVESSLLVNPEGTVFADPLAVALLEAFPAEIKGIAERRDGETGAVFFSPRVFAAKYNAEFCWKRGTFPVGVVRLADDSLLVPQGDGRRWLRITAALPAEPQVTYSPLVTILAEEPAPIEPTSEVTSALKGARGETRVYEMLANGVGTYTVRDVSHRARSADMVVETPSGKILVDAKDYNIAVPDKEVQKFRRDLAARSADAGVLVSLSSGIVGIRGTLTATLEALPTEGRIIPVVYAASGHEDVVRAAIDLAAYLAKVHPGTLAASSLHPRDALEAYARGLEDLADLYEDARAEVGRLASATAAGFGSSLERLGGALRDHRRLLRAQKSAIETVDDFTAEATDPALWAQFADRYSPPEEVAGVIKEILRALAARDGLGDIRESAHWRFLKTKAVHLASGAVFNFLKSRTDFCRQLPHVAPARVGDLLGRHPKKVRIADEVLALELGSATAIDAIELADA